MPDEPRPILNEPFYPPPPIRRGSFLGGPGLIFILLILLMITGLGVYGAATGQLGHWTEMVQTMDFSRLSRGDAAGNAGEATAMAEVATANSSGGGTLVLTPMGPAELLATRKPPRSLYLQPGEFDLPPAERFARPALFLGQKPRLAFVIVNLGHNQAVTAAAIADTPPEVTLSFSPYAPDLAAWIDAAHAFGHEVMLDLPMESRAYPQEDPGPLGLITALNETENQRRLDELLALSDRILGVATQRGDRFMTEAAPLRLLLAALGKNGYGLLVTSTGSHALPAAENGLAQLPPRALADTEITNDLSRQAIADLLTAALAKAARDRQALIVVQPYPLSIAALTNLTAIAKKRDLALVPGSAMMTKERP